MEFGRGGGVGNASILYFIQNCKILYYSIYVEGWKMATYWNGNSSRNVNCQCWSLHRITWLGRPLHKSQTFARLVTGWVGWPPPQTATSWAGQGCGRLWCGSWAGLLPSWGRPPVLCSGAPEVPLPRPPLALGLCGASWARPTYCQRCRAPPLFPHSDLKKKIDTLGNIVYFFSAEAHCSWLKRWHFCDFFPMIILRDFCGIDLRLLPGIMKELES